MLKQSFFVPELLNQSGDHFNLETNDDLLLRRCVHFDCDRFSVGNVNQIAHFHAI
jgi:hypothetical protein